MDSMSMESMPKFRSSDIEKQIRESAEKENIPLNKLENEAINTIVAKFNEQYPYGFKRDALSFTYLDRWCVQNVGKLIQDYPELTDEIEKVRMEVRNEIVYKSFKEVFDNASNEIAIFNPTIINPTWLSDHEKRFKYLVKKFYKTQDGEANWEYIRTKLNIGDDRWKPLERHRPEVYIKQLKASLEQEQPKKFNSTWIMNHIGHAGYTNLISQMHRLKSKNAEKQSEINETIAKLDWEPLLSELGEKWRERWFPPRSEYDSLSTYENQEEVDFALQAYKDQRYTIVLYLSEGKDKKKIAREIVERQVAIAQKGNKVAVEMLLADLFPMCQEYLLKYSKDHHKVMLDETQINKAVKVCIFRYDYFDQNGDFFRYILGTLTRMQNRQANTSNQQNDL